MKKLLIITLLLISFRGYSQFKNGTDGLTLTNTKTALENDKAFKKAMFERVIPITRIDSMYYETNPVKYGKFDWSYKYRFIIRDNKIITSVFTRTDYLNTIAFHSLKVIGGENHYSKQLYGWLNEVLTEIGGDVE